MDQCQELNKRDPKTELQVWGGQEQVEAAKADVERQLSHIEGDPSKTLLAQQLRQEIIHFNWMLSAVDAKTSQ